MLNTFIKAQKYEYNVEQKNLYQPCPLVNSLFPFPMSYELMGKGRTESMGTKWNFSLFFDCKQVPFWEFSTLIGWCIGLNQLINITVTKDTWKLWTSWEKLISLYWPVVALWATISLNLQSKNKMDSDKSYHGKSELITTQRKRKRLSQCLSLVLTFFLFSHT